MLSRFAKLALMASTFLLSASLFAGIGGTVYQGTVTSGGTFASRNIVQFFEDGTLIISDSTQTGANDGVQFPPFGLQHGYWKVKGKHHHNECSSSSSSDHKSKPKKIEIKTVDFQYPASFTTFWPEGFDGNQGIAVVTGTLKRKGDHRYEGDVFLTFYGLQDDLNGPGSGPFPAGHLSITPIDKP
jgi:hypothetical protein